MPRKPSGKDSKQEAGGRNPSFYEALGRAIKVLRTERGLSRKELAARAGVSYPYLADIESGRGRPSSSSLLGLSGALGISVSTLMAKAESYLTRIPEQTVSTHLRAILEATGDLSGTPPAAQASVPAAPKHGEMTASISAMGREELHRLVEELPDEDVPLALELARRLLGSRPPERA